VNPENEVWGWGIFCPTSRTVYLASTHKGKAEELLEGFATECPEVDQHILVQVRL